MALSASRFKQYRCHQDSGNALFDCKGEQPKTKSPALPGFLFTS
jgi:hypothetical protein